MLKIFVLGLPSVSVVNTILPVIKRISEAGYNVIYYNHIKYEYKYLQSAGTFSFRSYPDSFDGIYSERISEQTSYFQFGEILIDIASNLMPFLQNEVKKECPQLIMHSHLAVWGKLLSRKYNIPSLTMYSTFILEEEIMLPIIRKINAGKQSSIQSLNEAITFLRKSQKLYKQIGLEDTPNLWDIYINKGNLNVSYILDDFQPNKEIIGNEYHFAGHPNVFDRGEKEREMVYVSMGTIINKDITFYKLCLDVFRYLEVKCVISVGSSIDISELKDIPDNITILPFVDQQEILDSSVLFISRGGMASLHETISSLTPVIVIPGIPEQRATATKVEELGLGICIPPERLTVETLSNSIRTILSNREFFVSNIEKLNRKAKELNPGEYTLDLLNAFFGRETIVDLFNRQAKLIPHRVAVSDGNSILTYEDLATRSNQLGHYLLDIGLNAQDVVPVVMNHHVDSLVAMWAILKIGCIYVPIEPTYPEQRILLLLEDMRAKVFICGPDLASKIEISAGCKVLILNKILNQIEHLPINANLSLPKHFDLAYIIYTSGSTGRPKGVMIEHSQIYWYTLDVYKRLELKDCESYAMLGTFAADAGLTAVFGALCFGKTLVLTDIKRFNSHQEISDYFGECPVDCFKITPSLLSLLLEGSDIGKILPRKKLILGGEACSGEFARKVKKVLPENCQMYNHYGPTETTVGVITYKFPKSIDDIPDRIPLGYPLEHVVAYVLDEKLNMVKDGNIGELFIEGPLVARGYLNDPLKTNEKFIELKLLGINRRVYATGDLVRKSDNGNLEYLGRSDDQVKINGIRIEPKEVENVILLDRTIRQCVVLPTKNKRSVKKLAAYLVVLGNFSKERLIEMLRRQLPHYMIPAKFVVLDSLPLTFNNKIDRQALQRILDIPDARQTTVSQTISNGVEMILLRIWKRLLDLEELKTSENFFEVGGDSLLLFRLVYELTESFVIPITIMDLFGLENLTVSSLADFIENKRRSLINERTEILNDFDANIASVPQRNFFIQKIFNPTLSFPNSSLTFFVNGFVDDKKLETAFRKVIAIHESLKMSFFYHRNIVYKRVTEIPEFEVISIINYQNNVDEVIMNLTTPFDFQKPPLIRVFLLDLDGSKKYLHIDMPHINSDGESMKVIISDVVKFYNGRFFEGKRLQFTDFQKSYFEYVNTPEYKKDFSFWNAKFPSHYHPLWENKSSGEISLSKFTGSCQVSFFPSSLCTQIYDYLKGKNLTLYQFLVINFSLTIYRVTKADSFFLLLPAHNRGEQRFENIVGLLANVVPLKVDLNTDSSKSKFTTDCKKSILEAMSHQRFPYENIQGILKTKGFDVKRTFQVFFGYHQHHEEYRLHNATLDLYIPLRDKENLPLSVSVFNTANYISMRWSSANGFFSADDLQSFSSIYLDTIRSYIDMDNNSSISAVFAPYNHPIRNT